MNALWVDSDASEIDNGVFAFARYIEQGASIDTPQTVIVVANAHPESSATTATDSDPMRLLSHDGRSLLSQGQRLRRINLDGGPDGDSIEVQMVDGVPTARLTVGPQSFNLYRVEAN